MKRILVLLVVSAASCRYPDAPSRAETIAYLLYLLNGLPCSPCSLFVTSSAYQPGVHFSSVTQADALCRTDSGYPGFGAVYRAFLVAPGQRIACTTANCGGGPSEHLNWILHANTIYRRLSTMAAVMETNANGIFVFGTLSAPVWDGVPGWWTGINADWTFNSACGDNAWGTTGGNARFGDPNLTTSGALSNGLDPCSTTGSRLLCVQQQ